GAKICGPSPSRTSVNRKLQLWLKSSSTRIVIALTVLELPNSSNTSVYVLAPHSLPDHAGCNHARTTSDA
ncbi:hypothetical protein K438DRAFT_1879573, partial [Mycena galopus ATCC 62051]